MKKTQDLAFEAKSRAMAGQRMGGAETVEYVVALVFLVVIGSAVFAMITGTIKPTVENVGTKISTWFSNAA